MLPVIVGLIAGGLVLLASADKKESKSYDDGLKDGRKAADDEHKAKSDELKRLTSIARKQVRLERSSRRTRTVRDEPDDEEVTS
jgi:hypothetical protein